MGTGSSHRWTCLVLGVLVAGGASASPIQVTVDTSTLFGLTADLAFDLVDGGPPPNSVTISSFTSDGTLGSTIVLTGDVTGTLPGPVTIGDGSFVSEYRQDIKLGNSLSFILDTTGNPADVEAGSSADAFSLLLLDETGSTLLAPDGFPLLVYSIGEVEPLQVFSESVQISEVPSSAPEPGALELILAGLLGVALTRPTKNNFGQQRSFL
jgi:hypothetical protein